MLDLETLKKTEFPDMVEHSWDWVGVGYLPIMASAFDHDLDVEELYSIKYVLYDWAVKAGMLPEYMKWERRFLQLYDRLMTEGVYVYESSPEKITFFPKKNRKLNDFIVADIRGDQAIDMFFPGPRIRAFGCEKLNALLLLRDQTFLPHLEKMVHDCGLHIFPHVPPLSWEEAFPDEKE